MTETVPLADAAAALRRAADAAEFKPLQFRPPTAQHVEIDGRLVKIAFTRSRYGGFAFYLLSIGLPQSPGGTPEPLPDAIARPIVEAILPGGEEITDQIGAQFSRQWMQRIEGNAN